VGSFEKKKKKKEKKNGKKKGNLLDGSGGTLPGLMAGALKNLFYRSGGVTKARAKFTKLLQTHEGTVINRKPREQKKDP